nr:MAG TPA: hypothetical protein [Bacteriophage sp.]
MSILLVILLSASVNDDFMLANKELVTLCYSN